MTKTIALLHDNRDIDEVVSTILADEGYEVRQSVFGSGSLAFLQSTRPDLLIVDTERPWKEVLALLSALKADIRLWTMPVIVFTRAPEAWDKAAALRRQNCIILPHDIEVPLLLDAVEKVLGDTPPSSSHRKQAS